MRRSAAYAMGLFVVVGLLWAGIGYRYAGDHPLRGAMMMGGTVMVVGWVLVAVAFAVKLTKLRHRRRRSNTPG